jgi:hypothetical protein
MCRKAWEGPLAAAQPDASEPQSAQLRQRRQCGRKRARIVVVVRGTFDPQLQARECLRAPCECSRPGSRSRCPLRRAAARGASGAAGTRRCRTRACRRAVERGHIVVATLWWPIVSSVSSGMARNALSVVSSTAHAHLGGAAARAHEPPTRAAACVTVGSAASAAAGAHRSARGAPRILRR